MTRTELFDVDQEAAALARFDALVAEPATQQAVARRVRPNAATAAIARFDAGCAARDLDAVHALHREDYQQIDHPTGAAYGRDGGRDSLRRLLRASDPQLSHVPIATLGEALVLARRATSASATAGGRFDVGAWDRAELTVTEADEDERFVATEIFAGDRLGDALVRLYERYAGSMRDGPEHERAAATAHSIASLLGPPDVDMWDAVFAPAIELVDHRILGVGILRGAAVVRDYYRAMFELESFTIRVDEILGLEPHVWTIHATTVGTGRMSGGAFERSLVHICFFGSDGLVSRCELFDLDREAEALARFDALVGNDESAREPSTAQFENAASRAVDRETKCFAARDWDGLVALLSPAVRFSDRRRLMRAECGYDGYLAQERLLFDQSLSRWQQPLRATRGERLSLHRVSFEAEAGGGGGPLALEDHFAVVEVDADGRWIAVVLFDLADEDAAYAELDARFDAGEGAAHPHVLGAMRALGLAWQDHDWDALVACCASGFAYRDHRLLGFGTILDDAAKWARSQQALVELAPDTRTRGDHLRISQRGALRQLTQLGTRDGGAFETPFFSNVDVDEGGRILGIDIYDIENFDEARAHFDALTAMAAPQRSPFANAASRAMDRVKTALEARDWDAYARILAAGFRLSDRRRLVQLELDREQALEFARSVGGMESIHLQAELRATRGERLSLSRILFEGAEGDVGPSVIESLALVETNERGESIAWVRFDLEDQGTAFAELDARFEASEAGVHGNGWRASWAVHGAVARRDWDAVLAAVDPGLLVDDHRRLGWGTTLNSGALFVASQRALAELAPDFQYRFDHVRTSNRGYLTQLAQVGTREGGAFESPFTYIAALDASGRPERFDVYDVEDVGRAIARFDELNAAAPQPARFANAATRTVERAAAMFQARDWLGFGALFAAECRIDDRTALAQIETGRDEWLAAFRQMIELTSARPEPQVLVTRGDRLVLFRMRWQGAAGDVGPSEVDWLLIAEVDARGDHVLVVSFEPTAQAAAYAELDARWEAGEGREHAAGSAFRRDFNAALARRDWDAVAACYAPDFVGEDHRLVSWGTLRGPAMVAAFRTMVELAPDARLRWVHLRASGRTLIAEAIWLGTRDGGAFESPLVLVLLLGAHGKAVRADFYDPHHLDRALARFEALRAASK